MVLMRSAIVCFVTACFVAACGGGDKASEPPNAPTASTAPAAPAATATTLQPAAKGPQDEDIAPLLAWADSDVDEGKAPLTVKFMADVEGGKAPLTYRWSFGDGTPDSTEPNPVHVYEKAGRYQADLEVKDSAGDEDADYLEIEVEGQ
jgi:PKD repeat protein